MTPAEQLALWADQIRDLSATGLQHAQNIYDHDRYRALQTLAIQMLALATDQSVESFDSLRTTLFARVSPIVGGAAAIIDAHGRILLMRRADTRRWALSGGIMEVGETPAAAVVREAYEEMGIVCVPIALVGVYDSRIWDTSSPQHIYKFTFLCRPVQTDHNHATASHAHETLETGWFGEKSLPADVYDGHRQRIADAFRVWHGDLRPHFDP